MPDLSTVCPELSVDAAVDLLGGDAAADPATAATESSSGGDGAPIIPVECRWSGRVRAFDVQGAVPVTACPEARRGGERKSSSVPLPSSAPASLAPVSGRVLEDYVNEGVIAVTAGAEARRGGGRKNSSSAPLPPSAAAPAPASGRALEGYVDADVASLAASPEAQHGGGKESSAPLHSAATAVHAPAPAPGVKLEDYVNECAVSVTAYPEARRGGGKKPSSAVLPSAVALLPAPAPAPDLMLEDYVNKGVVSVTAHPEARRGSGKKSSSARSPLSPAATVLALASGRSLKDYVKEWAARRVASGASEHHCVLPFLTGAPKAVECRVCYKIIHPLEEIKCSVSRCEQMFHLTCVVEYTANFTAESFRCPQHGCMVCKQKMFFWRCGRCTVAAHTKCAPWPLIHLKDDQGSAICWRHPSNWLLQNENADLTNNIEEVFCRLPLPYVNEEFNIDSTIRNFTAIVCKPPSYTHIRRNVYLVKKKRADSSAETGCTNCKSDSVCKDDCECRGLSMSCSKSCHCSDLCSNKPFRKDKKIKIVKSEGCGWGAVALEPLEKVINDATCEQRLWDMKRRGDKNFYMCEISKDFTIDATFKGNTSRFLNHSCDPNCKLEKWQVEGETRVGVFASRFIEVGEPLTYDYRFVHFGEKVKCHCGAKSCQGYLGSQLKNPTQNALAAAALENKLLVQQGGCSPSRVKTETRLLPWTNCIEVPFNLRSKTKIDRICWGHKRQRTSLLDPSSSSASVQPSDIEAGAFIL
ncbi:hypothetical protein ACQJBY_058968 [Aegilops geniculata]